MGLGLARVRLEQIEGAHVPSGCGTTLSAQSPTSFAEAAVEFVNEQLWGTLAAAVTAPRDFPNERLDAALRRMRYGVIGVNQWPGVAFGLMSPRTTHFFDRPRSLQAPASAGLGAVAKARVKAVATAKVVVFLMHSIVLSSR